MKMGLNKTLKLITISVTLAACSLGVSNLSFADTAKKMASTYKAPGK